MEKSKHDNAAPVKTFLLFFLIPDRLGVVDVGASHSQSLGMGSVFSTNAKKVRICENMSGGFAV